MGRKSGQALNIILHAYRGKILGAVWRNINLDKKLLI
jgi:hypothetical protein